MARTSPKAASFKEFIQANPLPVQKRQTAWIESIPEFEEVCDVFSHGAHPSEIRHWLINGCGYSKNEANENRVDGWLKKHVQRVS